MLCSHLCFHSLLGDPREDRDHVATSDFIPLLGTLWGTSLVHVMPKRSLYCPPPPHPSGVVRGYNHRCFVFNR